MSSLHLWRAGVTTDLPVGEHTIEVEATDMFGRAFTETTTCRITESKPMGEAIGEE